MMDRNAVIVITGAAGFIGSCLTGYLNRKGYYNIIIVDDFSDDTKKHNYDEKKICARVDKEELFDWLTRYKIRIDFIFHLGAYTQGNDETGPVLSEKNTGYSKKIWDYCAGKTIPLVYTSFDDLQRTRVEGSATGFDHWVIEQEKGKKTSPPFWAALMLSQVYGPNEYHKGDTASLVFRYFEEVNSKGKITLQQSSPGNPSAALERDYDFVYVKDVVDVCYWMMQKSAEEYGVPASGFYDVGSGFSHSFAEIAEEIFKTSGKEPVIEYGLDNAANHPAGVIKTADISKLREAGYKKEFYTLSDGIKTYVTHFLSEKKYY